MLKKPFYESNRKELKRECASALSLLEGAKTFSNSQGYIFVTRKDNPKLFDYLDNLQFFEFYRNNRKRAIAGVHQIKLWLVRGIYSWRYCKNRMLAEGRVECHHLDSNPSNNKASNLTYVTPQQNSLCANAVFKRYPGRRALNSANVRSWAEYGGGAADTAKLIRKTIVCTFLAMGIPLEGIPSVANIFLQLPYKLGQEIVRYWQLNYCE